MRFTDSGPGPPAENLALDDLMLESGAETLRIWESTAYCVVLGRSGNEETDVNLEACRRLSIPVLRRSSGGGAVLVGPGCLNYTLILSLTARPWLRPVTDSYNILLSALARVLREPALHAQCSDLMLADRKISGNAQRRTRDWLLHHGTILCSLDLSIMEHVLPLPARQPRHRHGRAHSEFLAMLALPADEICYRIATWPYLLLPDELNSSRPE